MKSSPFASRRSVFVWFIGMYDVITSTRTGCGRWGINGNSGIYCAGDGSEMSEFDVPYANGWAFETKSMTCCFMEERGMGA